MNKGQGEEQAPMAVPGFRAITSRPNQPVQGILAWLRSAPTMMPNRPFTQVGMYDLANFILSLQRRSDARRWRTQLQE
jgi:hypothetical protein